MKPLLVNTVDRQGGAAIATYRLHQGLKSVGVNSQLLVQRKITDDPSVLGSVTRVERFTGQLRPYIDGIPTRLYPNREKALFSPAWLPGRIPTRINQLDPDLVHLFWVTSGFLRIESLRSFNRPIIWTLHDMWPFTGGCHYDDGCGGFQQACGKCPVLHSNKERDLSRRVWKRKHKYWSDLPIVVVATSRWLGDMARCSSIFGNKRIEILPNGIDTEVYKPLDKKMARTACNLPQDKKLIMFSAFDATSDKRKGGQFLLDALERLSDGDFGKSAELIIVGATSGSLGRTGLKTHFMGIHYDELSQVLLYTAADVLVAPSIQENLSNTVMESLSCGTPVVAFNIGGMPDMIEHEKNGYLATPFETRDLAHGISWVIESNERYAQLSSAARNKVEKHYASQIVANQYLDLYRDVTGMKAEAG